MNIKKNLTWEYVPKGTEPFFETIETFLFQEIFQTNVYSTVLEEIKNQNVLDIGAHFGFFTILASLLEAKQILSIEANPFNFTRFLKNTKDIKNLKAINAACTGQSGDILNISNDGMASRINTGSVPTTTVSFADALSFFPDKEKVFVKMDIEGAEHLIIKNTNPDLFREKVSIITLEMHDEVISGPGNTIESLKTYLLNLGYSITWQGWYTHSKDTCIVKFARK